MEEQNKIKIKSQRELNLVKEKLTGGSTIWQKGKEKMSLSLSLLLFFTGILLGWYLNMTK